MRLRCLLTVIEPTRWGSKKSDEKKEISYALLRHRQNSFLCSQQESHTLHYSLVPSILLTHNRRASDPCHSADWPEKGTAGLVTTSSPLLCILLERVDCLWAMFCCFWKHKYVTSSLQEK